MRGFALHRRYGRAKLAKLTLTLSATDTRQWRAGGKGRAKLRALAQAKANRENETVEVCMTDGGSVLVLPESKG